MNKRENLFERYRKAELDEGGESADRIDILGDLEEHLPSPQAIQFLADVISDRTDYDLARIEAMKIASVAQIESPENRVKLADALVSALADPDELIQQWAGNSAISFIDIQAVFTACTQILMNRHADLDARHNCLSAIQSIGPSQRAKGVLRELAADKEFRRHVEGLLEQWE